MRIKPRLLDGFCILTPEMEARDAYVPFLLVKPQNKNETPQISSHKEYNCQYISDGFVLKVNP